MHAEYRHTWDEVRPTGFSADRGSFAPSWEYNEKGWPLAKAGPTITVCGDGADGGGPCPCNGPGNPIDPGNLLKVGHPSTPGGTSSRADINGDGKADLLAIYDGGNDFYWYPGKETEHSGQRGTMIKPASVTWPRAI